jgi:hypothetical protein
MKCGEEGIVECKGRDMDARWATFGEAGETRFIGMLKAIWFSEMETGFGIGPIANLARLPDRFEACGRLQPTEPV